MFQRRHHLATGGITLGWLFPQGAQEHGFHSRAEARVEQSRAGWLFGQVFQGQCSRRSIVERDGANQHFIQQHSQGLEIGLGHDTCRGASLFWGYVGWRAKNLPHGAAAHIHHQAKV